MAVKVKHNGSWVDISGSSTAGTTKCAILEDQKPSNTNGGTFTSGAWRDRTLNSETDPQSFVTLDGGNVYFSLAAGTYEIDWSAPATMVDKHQTRLMFATNTGFSSGVGYVYGSSEYVDQNEDINADCTRSFGTTVKTITETTYFKIQHRCSTTYSSTGFGTPNNFTGDSQVEVYTQVKIEDLATAVKSSSNNLLNVWHVQKTDAQTIDTETWTDITGLSQTVTSTSASSGFLINATVNCGMSDDEHDGLVRLMRGTQVIGSTTSESGVSDVNTGFGQVAGQDAYRGIKCMSITYLDTPGAGTHTNHIEGINKTNGYNMLVNRRGIVADFYTTSHMTIQEIA